MRKDSVAEQRKSKMFVRLPVGIKIRRRKKKKKRNRHSPVCMCSVRKKISNKFKKPRKHKPLWSDVAFSSEPCYTDPERADILKLTKSPWNNKLKKENFDWFL